VATSDSGAEFRPLQILDRDGGCDERLEPKLTTAELHSLYRAMLLVRAVDTKAMNMHRQGRIGFFVPSFGEEAAQIGSAFALGPQDWIFPAYREQGAALLRGYPLKNLVCQFLGTRDDFIKGRQMPNHIGCAEARYATASSPVGTQIIHAVGAAYACRLRGDDSVALVYFGDGATSCSDFHAGMNFAGVWKTATVFFCKNNGYAISLPVAKQTATPTLAEKAFAYGMPGVRVDGNDVLAVYQATKEAVERARGEGAAPGSWLLAPGRDGSGQEGVPASAAGYPPERSEGRVRSSGSRELTSSQGPTFIEALTYRMGPHSSADDPTRYRDAAEPAAWQERCPIRRFRLYLERKGIWDETQNAEAVQEIEAEVNAAFRWAESLPQPDLDTLIEDVYAEVPWHLREQLEEVKRSRQ
jgi:2-oxoisovalerate dehydrogenase E1 component alpha subunit